MKIRILKEDKFFNYHTNPVKDKEIFDVTKTGMGYYDDFITNPSYMEKVKNLKVKIQYMTPKDYFTHCAKIFNTSVDKQIDETKANEDNIKYLISVIKEYGKQFPVSILDFANNTQEGRHRMYVAGELFGWDETFPVMIIDFSNKEKAKQEEERKNKEEIISKLNTIANNSLQYSFQDIEEIKDQLLWDADRVFEYEPELRNNFKIKEDNKFIIISTNGVKYKISKSDINIK